MTHKEHEVWGTENPDKLSRLLHDINSNHAATMHSRETTEKARLLNRLQRQFNDVDDLTMMVIVNEVWEAARKHYQKL